MNEILNSIHKGCPLAGLYPQQGLWTHWLNSADDQDLHSAFKATSSLQEVIQPVNSTFEQKVEDIESLPSSYVSELINDLQYFIDDEDDRNLVEQNLKQLAEGKSRAVVTGQQPGFGGGPLYSLFKISTTIALARLRTEQGNPSVPVFWLGDDDDDLAEALDAVLWNAAEGRLFSSHSPIPSRNKRQSMIGSVAFSHLEKRTAELLNQLSPTDKMGQDIQEIYRRAQAEDLNLSTLSELLLRRVFRGTGLVIVRGNDSRLHKVAIDFYDQIIPVLDELAKLTHALSGKLINKYGVSPLGANSLKRPLYEVEDNNRRPFYPDHLSDDVSSWRCGVLLRSLLQDWLLKPVAVVVGPGELSYLSQLTAAYELLDIKRAPLVPRLFGWILPSGFDESLIDRFNNSHPMSQDTAQRMAIEAGQKSEDELVLMMTEKIGVSQERAQLLASGRTRRWVKGVQTMLQNESQSQWEAQRPNSPAWVFPEGERQERKLAWVPVVTTWGQGFIDGILEASRQHLIDGTQGQWHEFLLRLPQNGGWHKESESS